MDNQDYEYEVYREVYFVTKWKNGSICAIRSDGYIWINPDEIKANRPRETNRIYGIPSPNFVGQTIRRKTV